MTNNQHGQVPEALIDLIDAYAETRHRCGGIYNARTEAARKAVIEALSGVQALSAAPADVEDAIAWLVTWKGGEHTYAHAHASELPAVTQARVMGGTVTPCVAALAASPTPPAEQPTPNTGHAEADRLIGRLMSSDPDFEDCWHAAALIQREIKGPDGFGTWREAAIAERLARVNQQAAPKAAPESFLDGADVQDESGVLAYYSREAVLACITAALESVAAPKAAPAGPSKSLPYEPTSAMLIAARERDPALPIETVRAIYWSMWRTAPTPPAQAADSVLEDAARLERARICAAIKAEDDYCVDQGDYMLDSDDCIKIVRGEWVRPDFAVDTARKQGDKP